MRKFKYIAMILMVTVAMFTMTACETPTKTINGITYSDYGIFNQSTNMNPKIVYEPDWNNIVVGILLMETIFVPIWVFGFHCMQPDRAMGAEPGVIPNE